MLGLFIANELGAVLCALAKLGYFVAIFMALLASWHAALAFALLCLLCLHAPGSYLRFKARHSVSVILRKR